ncbi:protein BatD [Pseudoxanthomonas kaohsiungensis]|uniref:protein BatD n=1 Tax=Pseudoxanthomonas kaohsiungensis TaxID=283923 RepID=UPI0035AFFC16
MAGLSTAHAETRAWLDRNAIAPGEAVTLNIETDQPGAAPDYTPLRDAFTLGPPYRSPATGNRTLFGIALTPRREGAVDIPALQVGAERTAPQKLSVSAAHASAPVPRGDVFLESRVDDPAPYVQQSLGLTVRLYYATPLLSGELAQDAPDGASLQRIGDDVQSSREIGGRRYHVVERRYLLVPERSGPLALPPARFRGQGAGGFFDDFFGTDRSLSAQGAAQTLQVRPQPDGAPQPWLPLRGLELEYGARPDRARAGEAVEIVVEAVAQGATAAQFPEIPAPQVEGAQVFADRAETTERFVDGGPQLTVVRRFSVVPLRPGPLRVPGTRLAWWDVAAGSAQVASLPDLSLEVAPGVAGASPAAPAAPTPTPAPPTASPATIALPADGSLPRSPWFRVAVAFALLWLATLAWLLWRKRDSGRPVVAAGDRDRPAVPSTADLRRLLDAGSFDEVVGLLQRMAVPAAADLDGVIARLDDPSQRDALDAMRRALWAGQGEPSAARAALRAAFRDGPRWRAPAVVDPAPLPPLYPP